MGREALCWLAGRLCVMVTLEQDQPCPELVPDYRINIPHTCSAWLLLREIHFEHILIHWPWIDVVLGGFALACSLPPWRWVSAGVSTLGLPAFTC